MDGSDTLEATVGGEIAEQLDGLGGLASIDVDVAREAARRGLFGEPAAERKVSRFTLLERVGAGGMGTVYAAHDPQLDRRVAVKLLGGMGSRNHAEANAPRMLAEARAMAKVSHPNVVSVYEVGVHTHDDGRPDVVFVAMEFVQGLTLRAWIGQRRPAWMQIVAAYADAGLGLAAVHAAGLVHRDFKPDNVMITDDGRVQVMDFGLARSHETVDVEEEPTLESHAVARVRELTQTGALAGTPAYMAPEQLAQGTVDHRSDQFAFCIALYEAIWGERPFPGTSPAEVAAVVVLAETAPEPPHTIVPRKIRLAIRRGLSPDPDARWPSMTALVAALRPRRRGARWVVAGLAIGGAGLSWGLLSASGQGDERPCQGSEAAFAEVWNDTLAERIRQAFGATELDYAPAAAQTVRTALDAYRQVWVLEHREACEATRVFGTQSEERLDARMRCLQRRRAGIDAFVEVLVAANETAIERAPDAVRDLVAPSRCRDEAYLRAEAEPPSSPEAVVAVEALRERLSRVEALWLTGQSFEALAAVRALLPEIDAVDYEPLRAEAEVLGGVIEVVGGESANATELLERGYARSRKAGSPIAATKAAIEHAHRISNGEEGVLAARAWLTVARAEVDANGLTDLESGLLYAESSIHEHAGDRQRTIDALLDAIEVVERTCVAQACSEAVVFYEEVGFQYGQLGLHEESLKYTETAVDLALDYYGPDHPTSAAALARRGNAFIALDRWEDALGPTEQAYRIRQSVLAPGSHLRASTALALGNVYAHLGRVEEGIAMMERAIVDGRLEGNALFTATMLNTVAAVYEHAGQGEAAERAWTEGIALMRAAYPDGHPSLAILLASLGNHFRDRGDAAQALSAMQEALTLLPAGGETPQDAGLHLAISGPLRDLGRTEEAIEHLRLAVELSEGGVTTAFAVLASAILAEQLAVSDPQEAQRILGAIRARCEALDEQGRLAARCVRLDRVDEPGVASAR